jgi:hypothetical protein
MDDAAEFRLVLKAILDGPLEHIRLKRGLERRVLEDFGLRGLTRTELKRLFVDHVRRGRPFQQKVETSEDYKDDYQYHYWCVVIHEEIHPGIFFKCVLLDDDEEEPQVLLVSIHQASFPGPKQ